MMLTPPPPPPPPSVKELRHSCANFGKVKIGKKPGSVKYSLHTRACLIGLLNEARMMHSDRDSGSGSGSL